MGKEIISEKEGIAISLFFLTGGVLIMPSGVEAHKDIWFAVIFSTSLGLLISLVYIKILSSFPGRDLFGISEIIFGKVIGKAVSLLYVWFAFHLSTLVFADFVYFVKTVSLPEIQILTIILFPAVLCIWGLKLGIEGMGRFSYLALIPLCFLLVLALLLLTPKMNFENFLPVLENGFQPIFKGTFSLFAFPFGESVIFMGIFNCFREKKSISRVYILSIILGGILLLSTKISVVSVLGINKFSQYYFPAYAAGSRISVGNFIQRIEIIVGLLFSVGALIKASVCMLTACKGISSILSLDDYRFLVTPMVMLNVVFMFISSKNIIQLTSWHSLAWRYYAFPFQVILPIIILVFSLIKKKSQNMPPTK